MKHQEKLNKMGKSLGQKLTGLLLAVLVGCLAFILLYPVLYMVTIAIRPSEQLYNPASIWIPRELTLENFTECINTMKYWQSMGNTLSICVVSAVLSVCSCMLAGYGFGRCAIPCKNVLFAFVILAIMVPPQVIILPQYLQMSSFDFFGLGSLWGLITGEKLVFNLLDSNWSFYLPAMLCHGIRGGLYIFIFRQFFSGMPKELEESAWIDGAGSFRAFFRVILPNATPAMVTVTLFSVVWNWNDYYYSTMFLSTRMTVSSALLQLKSMLSVQYGYVAISDPYVVLTQVQAGCLLLIGPLIILFVVLQKHFVESIERTGLVG